jgi:hypothetical protein
MARKERLANNRRRGSKDPESVVQLHTELAASIPSKNGNRWDLDGNKLWHDK